MKAYTCKKCGGDLKRRSENELYCAYCNTTYQDETLKKAYEELQKNLRKTVRGEIDEALVQQQELRLAKARQNLWEAIKEEHTDSKKILECVHDVKKLMPEDYAANFYELINEEKTKKVVKFIDKVDVDSVEGKLWAEEIILFTIKSLKAEYIIPVKDLIERVYKKADMEQYKEVSTLLDEEAKKVEEGIYEVSLPRDVFVMYSSADIEKVKEVVYALEESDVKCFFALRNLQHGVNAVENYDSALKTAMDNCKTVLFISSKHSRSLTCDVVRKELPYLRTLDQKHGKKHQKPRVEYRLDDAEILATKNLIKELFDGIEYCGTVEEVVVRVGEALLTGFEVEEEAKDVKYCKECGAKNELTARFCNACAGGEFVATKEEYNEIQQKREEEANVQREAEEARLKAEEKANALAEKLKALQTEKAAELKYCKACGAENDKKVKFCGVCGAKEFVETYEEYEEIKRKSKEKALQTSDNVKYCKACGSENEKSVNFCWECGAKEFVDTYEAYEENKRVEEEKALQAAKEEEAEAERKRNLKYCKACGAENEKKVKFCVVCGAKEFVETQEEYAKIKEQIEEWYQKGEDYYYGHNGVKEDEAEAVKWYKKAAELGHADAQYKLGDCYYNGKGVEEDKAEAVKWYKKAAEHGHAEAQYKLGDCYYYYSKVVEEDNAEAVKWYQKAVEQYKKAAEQGYAEAQYKLGDCYYGGIGVKQDYIEAVKWYQKAADQGHAKARYELGWCYELGNGVTKNIKKAKEWYKKAAEKGHALAEYGLKRLRFRLW